MQEVSGFRVSGLSEERALEMAEFKMCGSGRRQHLDIADGQTLEASRGFLSQSRVCERWCPRLRLAYDWVCRLLRPRQVADVDRLRFEGFGLRV